MHLQLTRMRTSGGREVRLERSERTLRQQRPAGRATQWRVILYHRPNSKSLLNEQAFLHLCLLEPRPDKTRQCRIRQMCQPVVGCGVNTLSDLHECANSINCISPGRPDKTRQRRIRQMCQPIVGCGVNTLSDLQDCANSINCISPGRPDKTRLRRIRQMYQPIVGCGVNALSDLHSTYFPAKIAPHISLSINGFVTESIVFFYICLNLFLRYLWLALAFSAVRFSVHGINRSDIHLFIRFFSRKA